MASAYCMPKRRSWWCKLKDSALFGLSSMSKTYQEAIQDCVQLPSRSRNFTTLMATWRRGFPRSCSCVASVPRQHHRHDNSSRCLLPRLSRLGHARECCLITPKCHFQMPQLVPREIMLLLFGFCCHAFHFHREMFVTVDHQSRHVKALMVKGESAPEFIPWMYRNWAEQGVETFHGDNAKPFVGAMMTKFVEYADSARLVHGKPYRPSNLALSHFSCVYILNSQTTSTHYQSSIPLSLMSHLCLSTLFLCPTLIYSLSFYLSF